MYLKVVVEIDGDVEARADDAADAGGDAAPGTEACFGDDGEALGAIGKVVAQKLKFESRSQ